MANRLAKYLASLISINHNAFSKGRSITENVLVAQEIVQAYGRTTPSPMCAIKIDLQKAFGSLNWSFILAVFSALGFPEKFIG